MSQIHEEKIRLRIDAKTRRDTVSEADRTAWSLAIAERFMTLLVQHPVKIVAGYWPKGAEADPLPILSSLHQDGVKVVLPAVLKDGEPMEFRLWDGGHPAEVTIGGVRQMPAGTRRMIPDLVIVPMLAYDRTGQRLGYGRGYYDRTLKELRIQKDIVSVGMAFSIQEVQRVPTERHDQKLDWILTERAAIDTRRRFG